jgi:hypothetical protein
MSGYAKVHAEYVRRTDDLMGWLAEVAVVARSAGHARSARAASI